MKQHTSAHPVPPNHTLFDEKMSIWDCYTAQKIYADVVTFPAIVEDVRTEAPGGILFEVKIGRSIAKQDAKLGCVSEANNRG